jgi:hypothetical protein
MFGSMRGEVAESWIKFRCVYTVLSDQKPQLLHFENTENIFTFLFECTKVNSISKFISYVFALLIDR